MQDTLDFFHNLVCELRKHLQSLAVVVNLRDLGRSEDHRRYVRAVTAVSTILTPKSDYQTEDFLLLRSPSKGELGSRALKAISDLAQLADLLELGLALLALQLLGLVTEEVLVCGKPRILRNTLVVLASQETRC